MRIQSQILLFLVLTVSALLFSTPYVNAEENNYDLNKIRMKIFHLLNFSPADNTLIPGPGSGTKATPTPAASVPTPTPVTGSIHTRVYILETSGENKIGEGTYTASTNSYRLQITKTVPLKSKSATNKYVLWLSKSTSTPRLNEFISSFDESSLPLTDKVYLKNLTEYDDVIVTEESTSTPTSPNLSAIIMPGKQAPALATPTPPAATPTPGGSGGSIGAFGSFEEFLRGILKF